MNDEYDLRCLPTTSLEWNNLSKLRNRVVRALNSKAVIPHTILIILGAGLDLEEVVKKSKKAITRGLSWVFAEIQGILLNRRRQLPLKCVPEFQTRILATRQLARRMELGNQYKSDCRCFNSALEKVCKNFGLGILEANDITSSRKGDIFKGNFHLTNHSYEVFWRSVDQALKSLDKSNADNPEKGGAIPKFENFTVKKEVNLNPEDDSEREKNEERTHNQQATDNFAKPTCSYPRGRGKSNYRGKRGFGRGYYNNNNNRRPRGRGHFHNYY